MRLENDSEEEAHQRNVTAPVVYDPWPQLPERYSEADYLRARYQPLNFTASNATWAWLFHPYEDVYLLQQDTSQNVSIADLKAAKYNGVLQWMGNSSDIGVFWYEDEDKVRCACVDPRDVPEQVKLASFIRWNLLAALGDGACNDDPYQEVVIEVQEPAVDITDIFEGVNGTEEYILYVQGYTNLFPGTVINLTIDRDRWNYHTLRAHTFNATVYGGWNNSYRKFRVKIPYDPDELKGGQHSLTAVTPFNTFSSVDFWVYEIPNGTPRPQTYLKYIDRNLWVPTPTPEVITKTEIQEVIREKVVTVNVTPAHEEVVRAQYDAYRKLLEDVVVVVSGIFTAIVIGYAGSVVYRVWKKGKK